MSVVQLLRIEISNQHAKYGLSSQKATIEIHQPSADMSIKQPQPNLTMSKTDGKLEIDQSEAFADANSKPIARRTREWAQQAKQKVIQDLEHETSEGRRLMSIESKNKNTIAEIAREQSEPEQKHFNIGFMPESAFKVKFHYTPSEIDIKIDQHQPKIKIKPNLPVVKYHPGDLQIYLRQKPSIQFKVVGSNYDRNG